MKRRMGDTQKAKKPKLILRFQPREVLVVGVLLLIVYVVVPQLGSFRQSLDLLRNAQISWVIMGASAYMTTSLLSVGIYMSLTSRHLPFFRTAIVQYGSTFANRLLPAGVGALGVDYLYLRKQRCTQASALAALALNNMLGTVGHLLLFVVILVALPHTFDGLHVTLKVGAQFWIAFSIAALVVAVAVIISGHFQDKLAAITKRVLTYLKTFRHKKWRLVAALIFSMILTLMHAVALWGASNALGAHVSIAQAVIVIGIGVTLGALVPSPGGLGGVEVGLVASLIALQLSASTSLAVAILYRLMTYWLGFAFGAPMFYIATSRKYF